MALDSPGEGSQPPDRPPWPGAVPPEGRWGTPPTTETPRRRIVGCLIILALLLVVAVAALAILAPGPFGRLFDAIRPGTTPVTELAEGQCFDGLGDVTEDGFVIAVTVVDCAAPHEAELYATFTHPDAATYPGEEAVTSMADQGCVDRFDSFAGISYARSTLEATYLFPTAVSWREGDRVIQCVLHSGDGQPLTESMRGRGE